MELTLKPHPKNTYPLGGIWVRQGSVSAWVSEIQRMGFALETVAVYPIPGNEPLSLWGCLLLPGKMPREMDLGQNTYAQCVNGNLYIPENSVLFPGVSVEEMKKLFPGEVYAVHPEFGWVELAEPLDWQSLLTLPVAREVAVHSPAKSVFLPSEIKSFQIKPVPPEEALNDLAGQGLSNEGIGKLEDDKLSTLEKIKLRGLRSLFRSKKEADGTYSTEKTSLGKAWEKFTNLFGSGKNKGMQRMQERFENLEERNKKAIDRLLDMFSKNLDEALKYAIPLDSEGTTRGGTEGALDLNKRWSDFSLMGNTGLNRGPASGSVNLENEQLLRLTQQYRESAERLVTQKEYRKAAFIYIKLLKEHQTAANVMESGKLYQEAAAIHLTYTKNKAAAAHCYEKGYMYNEAIDLYKEVNQYEKAGDLYLQIGKKAEAREQFGIVADGYKTTNQYVKASLIYRNKMENPALGQDMLMQGWRSNHDAYNCLNNYFNNMDDIKQLGLEIDRVYRHEVEENRRRAFLDVIKLEFAKKNGLEEPIRDMAYEIIAGELKKNADYAVELRNFNTPDNELTKDTVRYKLNRKKR